MTGCSQTPPGRDHTAHSCLPAPGRSDAILGGANGCDGSFSAPGGDVFINHPVRASERWIKKEVPMCSQPVQAVLWPDAVTSLKV